MNEKELQMYIITQLILEYRASLETVSKIFNMNPAELYNELISTENEITRDALLYVLDHETKEPDLIDQDVAKRKIRVFLTKFHMAKTPQEKVAVIKTLDNSEQIEKLKSKGFNNMVADDFFTIIKYRYKYALPRRKVQLEFGITKSVLERREATLDEETKKRMAALNDYSHYISTFARFPRK